MGETSYLRLGHNITALVSATAVKKKTIEVIRLAEKQIPGGVLTLTALFGRV